jgi:hypothetical protein
MNPRRISCLYRVATFVGAIVLALAIRPTAFAGTPPSAPIKIEASRPPATMNPGDAVDTSITVTALADLPRLEITIYAVDGITLLSDAIHVVYDRANRNDAKQFTVRVRLDEKQGSLAVLAEALTAGGEKAGSGITVTYGLR